MHPADEYAFLAAEIRRLKARQSSLREKMISDPSNRLSNRYEIVVQDAARRVFLRDKLPKHILADERFWEVRVSPRVSIKDSLAADRRKVGGAVSNGDDGDFVLIEDF